MLRCSSCPQLKKIGVTQMRESTLIQETNVSGLSHHQQELEVERAQYGETTRFPGSLTGKESSALRESGPLLPTDQSKHFGPTAMPDGSAAGPHPS